MADDVGDAVHGRSRHRGESEEVGKLVHDDDHGHTAQEPGDDRRGEEVGDPAQPHQAHHGHEHTHDDRQQRHQSHVVRGPGRRDVGDPGCEEGSDGGVGADRQLGGRAEYGESDGPGDEDVEPGDGRHPGQTRRRQLLGDGDRQQREPGQEVGSQPLTLVPVQRAHEGGHLQLPTRGRCGRHGVTGSPVTGQVTGDVSGPPEQRSRVEIEPVSHAGDDGDLGM